MGRRAHRICWFPRRWSHWLALLAFLMLAFGSNPVTAENDGRNVDGAVFQVSTLSALLAGDYDGRLSFRELKRHGTFGLGTFDRLDGEMVAIDGKFFQVRVDGKATRVRASETTPFAVVTSFDPDIVFEVNRAASCETLRAAIRRRFRSETVPYAIKVTGLFSTLETRSVPPQEKPYPPLDEALKQQVTFDHFFVEATMAGFWMPEVLGNVNATGFHFHALTKDEDAGGHVLDCEAASVTVAIDRAATLEILFGKTVSKHHPSRRH